MEKNELAASSMWVGILCICGLTCTWLIRFATNSFNLFASMSLQSLLEAINSSISSNNDLDNNKIFNFIQLNTTGNSP